MPRKTVPLSITSMLLLSIPLSLGPARPAIKIQMGRTSWVQGVDFSRHGKLAVSGSTDRSVRIWDVATLLAGTGRPPEVEIAEVAGVMGGASVRLSPEALSRLTGPPRFDGREVTIGFRAHDRGGGVGRAVLSIEGTPVAVSGEGRGISLGPTTATLTEIEATVTLRYGENQISFVAYNTAGTVASRDASISLSHKESTVQRPRLFILAVAVDQCRDRSLRLNFSVEDADAIALRMEQCGTSLYSSVEIQKLYDAEVSRAGFAAAFDRISSLVAPDDDVLFYLAGHGVTYEKDGDYYYLPVDFRYTGSEAIETGGISKSAILENLVKVRAQKAVSVFDTCNAGSSIEAPGTRGLGEKTAIDRLRRVIGRATIVASSEDQVALEGHEGHGVFAYAVLQGLAGRADGSGDGYITVGELSVFVGNMAPDLTYGKWGYEQVSQKQLPTVDFPVAGVP